MDYSLGLDPNEVAGVDVLCATEEEMHGAPGEQECEDQQDTDVSIMESPEVAEFHEVIQRLINVICTCETCGATSQDCRHRCS